VVTGTIGVVIGEIGGVTHMVLGAEYGRHCTVTARRALSQSGLGVCAPRVWFFLFTRRFPVLWLQTVKWEGGCTFYGQWACAYKLCMLSMQGYGDKNVH